MKATYSRFWDIPSHRQGIRLRLIAALPLVLGLALPLDASAQTGKLNDTGILTCANATSNSVPCGYADNDTYGYPRQDTEYGRSAKENAGQSLGKTGGSDANSKGFDFSKMQNDGTINQAATLGTAATNWGCTRDNVTGLIWLVKTAAGNDYRLNTTTYRWYSTDGTRNGGNQGDNTNDAAAQCYFALNTGNTTSQSCNTKALVDYVNTQSICGEGTKNDWRLPTRLELLTIVDLSKQGAGTAATDSTYFPNMMADNYWTQDTVAGSPAQARIVNFYSGGDGVATKSSGIAAMPSKNYVILVRPSP